MRGTVRTADPTRLPDQFRQGTVIADEVLRAASEVSELRGRDVNSQPVIQRSEDVAEMNRAIQRILSPARRRAYHLTAAHSAPG